MTKEQFFDKVRDLPGIDVAENCVKCNFGLELRFIGDSICDDSNNGVDGDGVLSEEEIEKMLKVAEAGDFIFCSDERGAIKCVKSGTFDEQLTNQDANRLIKIVEEFSNIYKNVVTENNTDIQILLSDMWRVNAFLYNLTNYMTDLKTGGPITQDTEIFKLTGIKITDDLIDLIPDITSYCYAITPVVEEGSQLYFEDGPEIPFDDDDVEFIKKEAAKLEKQYGKRVNIYTLFDD